jgi:putative SOS response-associated peptidase YedK
MRWGLIPFWAKDESIGYKMINARAETVAEKPAYRKAFEQRRCLVLADGFYEWKKVDGGKVPHRFVVGNKEPFAFAGLWERWWRPDGEGLQTFTIITTEPNELAREVHNRMPVILAPEHYEKWLDSQFNDVTTLRSMLTPFPASRMKCHAVSPYVSNARNEGPQCIVPV